MFARTAVEMEVVSLKRSGSPTNIRKKNMRKNSITIKKNKMKNKEFKIGLFLVATNKYKQFVDQLLKSADEYFFAGHKLNVYLFTDDPSYKFSIPSRISIKYFKIESLKFPYATLLRYKMFSQIKKYLDCDYVFYSDVDCRFVDFVGEEILPLDLPEENRLVAVRHCGFYGQGGGGWETRKESIAYIAPEKRIFYYAGGFQGGSVEAYMSACETMRDNIEADKKNGVISVWHDESHWNQHLSERLSKFKELTPDYCMVEQEHLRKKWKVDGFKPKLLALEKNHEEIRE